MARVMSKDEFFAAWSSLHGGVEVSGAVKGWLLIARPIASLLAKLKISAHFLTAAGVVASFAVWRCAAHPYAIAILALALALDGLDGSTSILLGTSSNWGAILDSCGDRIAEFFWALTFYALGASWWIVGIAWLAAFVQEYVRARLAALDSAAITYVSICERPVRAIFLGLGMLFSTLALHGITGVDLVQKSAIFWSTFQVVALVTVLVEAFTRLRSVNSIDN